jgi:hypothetical protein
MGHRSVAFTMDRYADTWPEQIERRRGCCEVAAALADQRGSQPMKYLVATVLICAGTFAASPVFADIPVKAYKGAQKTGLNTSTRAYLYGVGRGFVIFNVELVSRQQQPLFCPPGALALAEENFITFINQGIKGLRRRAGPYRTMIWSNRFLLYELIAAFPCK